MHQGKSINQASMCTPRKLESFAIFWDPIDCKLKSTSHALAFGLKWTT